MGRGARSGSWWVTARRWSLPGSDPGAVRSGDHGAAARLSGERPSGFMLLTQQHQVVDVRRAAMGGVHDVVGLQAQGVSAAGELAVPVARLQREALQLRHEPGRRGGGDGLALPDQDRSDPRLAGQLGQLGGGERGVAGQGTGVVEAARSSGSSRPARARAAWAASLSASAVTSTRKRSGRTPSLSAWAACSAWSICAPQAAGRSACSRQRPSSSTWECTVFSRSRGTSDTWVSPSCPGSTPSPRRARRRGRTFWEPRTTVWSCAPVVSPSTARSFSSLEGVATRARSTAVASESSPDAKASWSFGNLGSRLARLTRRCASEGRNRHSRPSHWASGMPDDDSSAASGARVSTSWDWRAPMSAARPRTRSDAATALSAAACCP